MKKKRYQVFISSTYEDLKSQRAKVIESLWCQSYIPVGMEYFNASDSTQLEYIDDVLDSTDIYVLILGGRYGSIDSKSDLSYTEREYQLAKNKDIPILSFICENPERLTADSVDSNPQRKEKLEKFRDLVEKGTLCSMWNAEAGDADLALKVVNSVTTLASSRSLNGWNRGSENDEKMQKDLLESTQAQNELQNKVKQLEKQKQNLQEQIELLNQDDAEDENLFENKVQLLGRTNNFGNWKKFCDHLTLGRIFKLMAGDILTSCPAYSAMLYLERKLSWEFGVDEVSLSPSTEDEIKVQLYMNHLIDLSKEPDTDEPGEIEVMTISDKGKRLLSSLVHDGKYDEPAVTTEQTAQW